MPVRMHADEVDVDADLVRRLVAGQLPVLAGMPVRAVRPRGTVNAVYRLGDELCVRLPRVGAWAEGLDRERRWLPRLRGRLTLAVPEPVAWGAPAAGYPFPWAVYRWIEGEPYDDRLVDDDAAAADALARFVSELRSVEVPVDAPPGGRRPLPELDAVTREAVAAMGPELDPAARAAVTSAWERALEAPAFAGPPVWVHADLLRPNLLVRDGRLVAVLDFGGVGVGDPAADVVAAWSVLGPAPRRRFRAALSVDDATWERARGYALHQALLIVPYYRQSNRPFAAAALRTVGEVVGDLRGRSAALTGRPPHTPRRSFLRGRPPGGSPNAPA